MDIAVASGRRPKLGGAMNTYRVAERYSADLGGRFDTDGDYSGQDFRDRHLMDLAKAAITEKHILTINFDGCSGLPTSFSEEAFGGLARALPNFSRDEFEAYIKLEAPSTPKLWAYINFARDAMLGNASPRKH